MQVGQLAIGIGIGLGLAVGSVGGWTAFQRWQSGPSAAVAQSTVAQSTVAQSTIAQSTEPQPTTAQSPAISVGQEQPISLSQAENDYLYDLSVALQPVEQRRLSPTEKLAIGQQVADWLQQGQDYWGVRRQFDQAYRSAVAGDYGHNRDVYIKFATERLAPTFVATLTPPPEVIVKTRTRYVETPGETQFVAVPGETRVIREVVHVPKPFPVPEPYPVPVPHSPHQPHPDDQAHLPDQPEPHPHPDYPSAHHPDRPRPNRPHANPPKPIWPDAPQADQPLDSPQPDELAQEPPALQPELSQPEPSQPEPPQPESPQSAPSQPETIQVSAEPEPLQ